MADNAIAVSDDDNGARPDPFRQMARSPAARQVLLLVAIAAAVAFGVAVVLWSRGPNYGLLYAGLDQKDAAAVAQELQSAHTPFQLSSDGTSIMAPAADLAALRLKLAAKGLPQGSASSSVMSATDSPFGMSDLAERTRYQQLLEADLSSTISGLQSVRAARVHLALPKPSAFIRDNRLASASVLVTLYQGRQLDSGQVAAIVHLVSSSVPGLDANQVSVVDQQGQLLTSDPNSPSAVGDDRLRMATRIENTYAQRIEELLTPLVGPGRVRAQVYADLDFSQQEKATETFGHEHPALRSEQTSSEQHSLGGAGGIPGALSNQPPTLVAQATAANPNAGAAAKPAGKAGAATTTTATTTPTGDNSSSATRNYELDRTISHVSDPAGRLARLTVAVVLDNKLVDKSATPAKTTPGTPVAAPVSDSVPFSAQELERLTELTKNAVGFDAARGDSVSVVNQPFHRPAALDAPVSTPLWERPGAMDLIKQGLGVLIALLVAFGLVRPLLKGVTRGQPAAKALPAPTHKISVRVDDEPRAAEAARIAEVTPTLEYEQRIGLARQMVGENSKQVAQVVKNWVSEDGG